MVDADYRQDLSLDVACRRLSCRCRNGEVPPGVLGEPRGGVEDLATIPELWEGRPQGLRGCVCVCVCVRGAAAP